MEPTIEDLLEVIGAESIEEAIQMIHDERDYYRTSFETNVRTVEFYYQQIKRIREIINPPKKDVRKTPLMEKIERKLKEKPEVGSPAWRAKWGLDLK